MVKFFEDRIFKELEDISAEIAYSQHQEKVTALEKTGRYHHSPEPHATIPCTKELGRCLQYDELSTQTSESIAANKQTAPESTQKEAIRNPPLRGQFENMLQKM